MSFIKQTIDNLSTSGIIPSILYFGGLLYVLILLLVLLYNFFLCVIRILKKQ